MSNQQWPPPPGNQPNNPWASQDPNWQPQQFKDAQARDPRLPFGHQATPPPQLEQLTPPKKPNSSLFIILGVIAVVAAILIGMQFLGGSPNTENSPTATAPAEAEPTATRTGNYIPFEGNGDGIFEIVNYEWAGDELRLRIRVEVERGEYGFAVFAFTKETRESYDPVDWSSFTVREGEPVEKDIVFLMPNADSTIVLTTPSGHVALNALDVKGS